MKLVMLFAALVTVALAVPAQAAFKCKEDGKIIYQDAPCDGEGHRVDTSGGVNYQSSQAPRQHTRSRITR